MKRYLMRAIMNRCCDLHRRRRTAPIPINQISIPCEPTPTEDYEQQQEYNRIHRLLDQLPPEQAEVIRLKAFASMTFAEIAEATKTSESTAKSRFRYGIQKLRELINH